MEEPEEEKKVESADGSGSLSEDGTATFAGTIEAASLTVDPSAIAAASISIGGGGLTITPGSSSPGYLHIPASSTTPLMYDPDAEAKAEEEAERLLREQELVVLPTKKPKKVLVAFIDDDGDGATDPYWAAYLEPKDLDLFLGSDDNRDAHMVLKLGLVKKYEQ